MFKTLTTIRRQNKATAFFHEVHPQDPACRVAIYELYIKTGRLISTNLRLSEDQLTFEVRMEWDCEQSFIDYFTEDNNFISAFNYKVNQYIESQNLISNTIVEE